MLYEVITEIHNGDAEVGFYSREAINYGGELVPLNRWPDQERLSGHFDLPAKQAGEL